jgi:hypothetical protein
MTSVIIRTASNNGARRPTQRTRPAKDAGQAGQAALGFVRFVGEVRGWVAGYL